MAETSYDSADFHEAVRRQIVAAATAALGEAKIDWEQVQPLLEAARALCRADLAAGGVELHATRSDGGKRADAEEAFLALWARDRDTGEEWLSRTWWLSDLVIARGDPNRVREVAAGLARTLGRLNEWLAAQESGANEPSADKA